MKAAFENSSVKSLEVKAHNENDVICANPKIVCYTCITSGYDTLAPIKYPSKSIDFICFTDNMLLTS